MKGTFARLVEDDSYLEPLPVIASFKVGLFFHAVLSVLVFTTILISLFTANYFVTVMLITCLVFQGYYIFESVKVFNHVLKRYCFKPRISNRIFDRVLEDPNFDMSELARALVRTGHPRAIDVLVHMLEVTRQRVNYKWTVSNRDRIIHGLSLIDDARVTGILLAALEDPELVVRAQATVSLAIRSDYSGLEVLLSDLARPSLEDSDSKLIFRSLKCLTDFNVPVAVSVVQLLVDSIVQRLVDHGETLSVTALERYLDVLISHCPVHDENQFAPLKPLLTALVLGTTSDTLKQQSKQLLKLLETGDITGQVPRI